MTKYTEWKRRINIVLAILCLFISIYFSQMGFGTGTNGKMQWIGWVLAASAGGAQMIFNSEWRKLNLTIILLGIAAYVYSIDTNIVGINDFRGGDPNNPYTILNTSFGFFIDLYPEIALSWAFGESTLGDIVGNSVKTFQNWKALLHQSSQPGQQSSQPGQQFNQQRTYQKRDT